MKRTVSIVLLLAMLAGLVSCGAGTDKPTDTTPTDPSGAVTDAPVSGTEGEPAKEPSVADLLPKADFDGATVGIAMDFAPLDYIPSEEVTGSAINDAIVDRTRAVEELYNVDLEYFTEVTEPIQQYVTWSEAGDDTYKLYTSRTRYMGEYITKNAARSWSDYPEILDFHADWFNTYAIETFAVGDDVRLLYGDVNESAIRYAWIWLFNKELAEQYHLPDLYTVVDEGKWTMDYLMTVADAVYSDVNGNGDFDEEDVYGYLTDNTACYDSWGPTLGVSPIRKDENNRPVVITELSEEMINGFEKLYTIFWLCEGTYVFKGEPLGQVEAMFVRNKAVLTNTRINLLENDRVRDMVDFGVLPTPKLTEDQDTYYTHTDCMFSCLLLPSAISNEDALRSVYIANALNAFSHEMVLPVYYEIVLKTRLTRDKDSPRMMDLALAGRRYGFEYMAESAVPITHVTILREFYSKKTVPSASMYERRLDSCKKWVNDFLEDWDDMVYWENKG